MTRHLRVMDLAQYLDRYNLPPADLVDMQIARNSLEVGRNRRNLAPAAGRQKPNIGIMDQIVDIDRAIHSAYGAPQPRLKRKYHPMKPLPADVHVIFHCRYVPRRSRVPRLVVRSILSMAFRPGNPSGEGGKVWKRGGESAQRKAARRKQQIERRAQAGC